MKKILLLTFLLTSCSTIEVTKLTDKEFPKTSEDKVVRSFHNKDDFIYTPLCRMYLSRGIFYKLFTLKFSTKSHYKDLEIEARNCGGNGILAPDETRWSNGDISIGGTAVLITSQGKKIKDKDISKLSLAIQTSNIDVMKSILQDVSKKREKRSPRDSAVIDALLYAHSRYGTACEKNMLGLLQKYEAVIPEFSHIIMTYNTQQSDQNIIFCGDALYKSFSKIKDKKKFVIKLNNYFVEYYNKLSNITKKELPTVIRKLSSYKKLLKISLKEAQKSCEKSKVNNLCMLKIQLKTNLKLINKQLANLK